MSNPCSQKLTFMKEIGQNFKQENLTLDYFDKDWADLLQIDQQNVNLSMESFLINMNCILDAHAPLKNVIEYKLKFNKTKPWITPALE